MLSVTASSGQSPVPLSPGVSYNVFGQPTTVPLGSGSGDQDAFQYDSSTGRMTQFNFTVNSSSLTGNLTWNANGSLQQLAITDGFNSADTQTCSYLYDDILRINNVDCLQSSTHIWTQALTPGALANLSKTGSNGGTSFLPNYNAATNRINSVNSQNYSYDANGNITSTGTGTGTYAYGWDAEGNLESVTPSGSGATSVTYDALGREVEAGSGSGYTQYAYGPQGNKLALMNGQTLSRGRVPLPGGGTAIYTTGLTLLRYWHADWLGSARLATNIDRTFQVDTAYAPFGEQYADTNVFTVFTGQENDTTSNLYDFPFRKYDPTSGRWMSPDPAGLGAVDLTNPQSLNRYAYALNNPTTLTDPKGLCPNSNPNCPGPGRQNVGGFNDAVGGLGGSCYIDGLASSCFVADQLLNSDAAAVCPNNFCSGFIPLGNGQQAFAQFNATLGTYNVIDQPFYPGLSSEQYLNALNAQLGVVVEGLEAQGATDKQIYAFESAVLRQYNNGGIPLAGGNFDFPNSTINANGNASSFNFNCGFTGRCNFGGNGFATLDFSHNNGTFHLDTGNPWDFPFGTAAHTLVDVFLGNYWYQVIPRPWP